LDRGLGALAYLGGIGLLALAALRSTFRAEGSNGPLVPALIRQCDWLFGMGLPLVGLVHVGLGSFLAMQAFYGATFIEAVGPVVGTGLMRNVAPLLTGLTMAGLLAARLTYELRYRPLVELDTDTHDQAVEPDARIGVAARRRSPDTGRLTAVRVISAMLTGPILALWGSYVGIVVGCLVAEFMLGVPVPLFFAKFYEMLWVRDVVGVVLKGAAFLGIGALVACFEGLRSRTDDTDPVLAPFRAACVSALLILLVNNTWFTLVYLAGPPFGPTVLAPPPR
jgi:phospholipid/cholesterol/gamma-HCH transport system permease protein